MGLEIAKGEYVLLDKEERPASKPMLLSALPSNHSMVAIGRLAMSTRERICTIEIEQDGLIFTTLRMAEEVRGLDEVGSPDLPRPCPYHQGDAVLREHHGVSGPSSGPTPSASTPRPVAFKVEITAS